MSLTVDRLLADVLRLSRADRARFAEALRASLDNDGEETSTGRRMHPDQPSSRQREYLQFIVRYLAHFGTSPAEADIQHHFMVSAPSVNQMMKTLERRGFITRGRDIFGQVKARSIRVVVDLG